MSSNIAWHDGPDEAGPPVILVWPPGNAGRPDTPCLIKGLIHGLYQRFDCTRVLDEWDGRTPLQPGDLAITSMSVAQLERVCATPIVPADTRMLWTPWAALNFVSP